MSTLTAKDLTREFPRSPYDELAGLPWLPRLIDKVRALKAGTIGDYTPFPCGGDQNFISTYGLDPQALKAVIDGGATDEAIARWVGEHLPTDWEAKRDAYRASARAAIPAGTPYHGYLQEAIEGLKSAQPGVDASRVDNFARLLCVEEGHPLQ